MIQAEAEQLEKTHRTAAEQREQFQHEVLKIEHDLQDMKLNYQEAASSVQSLISKLKDCSLNQHEMSPKPAIKANPRETEEMVLTQEKLTQLRKLNQLSMAKVEKTEKEVKGKLAEVEKEKHQLQTKIRYIYYRYSVHYIYTVILLFMTWTSGKKKRESLKKGLDCSQNLKQQRYECTYSYSVRLLKNTAPINTER